MSSENEHVGLWWQATQAASSTLRVSGVIALAVAGLVAWLAENVETIDPSGPFTSIWKTMIPIALAALLTPTVAALVAAVRGRAGGEPQSLVIGVLLMLGGIIVYGFYRANGDSLGFNPAFWEDLWGNSAAIGVAAVLGGVGLKTIIANLGLPTRSDHGANAIDSHNPPLRETAIRMVENRAVAEMLRMLRKGITDETRSYSGEDVDLLCALDKVLIARVRQAQLGYRGECGCAINGETELTAERRTVTLGETEGPIVAIADTLRELGIDDFDQTSDIEVSLTPHSFVSLSMAMGTSHLVQGISSTP